MGLFGSNSKKRDNGRDYRAFDDAYREAGDNIQFLLRRSDLMPVYISSNFERVLGVSPDRLADDVETLLRFVPDMDRVRLRRSINDWDKASPLHLRSSYKMPDGSAEKHLRMTVTVTGGGEYTLFDIADVTGEQELIAKEAAEREKAQAAARERMDFMSQMSHEVRTPLNGIKGTIILAREHHTEEERLLDDLTRASELSSYLLSLINDVLDMSRLNAGRVELESLPFDMRLAASDLSSMFASQAVDKKIEFTINLDECEHHFLVGDRMRLNQVVVNFISNALKFTDEGGHVDVTFREMYSKNDEVSYMIRVRDTGKGMDPRFISRIFKPFEQEDRTIARRYGGTGLGMAITSALVDLMGGEIVVDTELGRGSDFTVYLPFKLAVPAQIEQLKAEQETLETMAHKADSNLEYSFEGKHYLIAEDNELNAMIAVELLASVGAKADTAGDGTEAIEAFAASEPGTYDAILMDIQMPTLNGWEATKQIRALDHLDARTVPIIALSANNYVEDARKSREAGMNGHAGKPIDFVELKAQLAAATAESAYIGGVQA